MSNIDIRSAKRPDWDQELVDIADFVCDTQRSTATSLSRRHITA